MVGLNQLTTVWVLVKENSKAMNRCRSHCRRGYLNRNSIRWVAYSCRALSCACAVMTGECRTCRSRALCNCKAYPMCGRASVSSGPNCWQNVGRNRRIRI